MQKQKNLSRKDTKLNNLIKTQLNFSSLFKGVKTLEEDLVIQTPTYKEYSTFYSAYDPNIDSPQEEGLLVIGQEYSIEGVLGVDDFLNVGYNEEESTFIATGTTPTVWASGTQVYTAVGTTITFTHTTNTLETTIDWVYDLSARKFKAIVGENIILSSSIDFSENIQRTSNNSFFLLPSPLIRIKAYIY